MAIGRQLVSRLAILALWTLIVIFLLYRYSSDSSADDSNFEPDLSEHKTQDSTATSNPNVHVIRSANGPLRRFASAIDDNYDQNVITNSDPSSSRSQSRSTGSIKRPSREEYSREAKVFILIVQEAPLSYSLLHPSIGGQRPNFMNQQNYGFSQKTVLPSHLQQLIEILESHRIGYTLGTTRNGLPESLLNDHRQSSDQQSNQPTSRYSVIVIDDFVKYTKLNRWMRDQLDRHCRANGIGVIAFVRAPGDEKQSNSSQRRSVGNFPLSLRVFHDQLADGCRWNSSACLVDYQLNQRSPVLRILKGGPETMVEGPLEPNTDNTPWVSIWSNHVSFEPIAWAKSQQDARAKDPLEGSWSPFEQQTVAMLDRGNYDGVRRILLGGGAHFWQARCLLLDSIEHLSAGKILTPLDRYIQIDIDDIFVGERGTRMNASDVDALVEAQRHLAKRLDGGFRFNLGFSGHYFKRGTELENEGDQRLVDMASEFSWFCHFWSHSKAHLMENGSAIEEQLTRNLEFAQRHGLPLASTGSSSFPAKTNSSSRDSRPAPSYAVAPHHSGVYPVHEQLYEAWLRVLNVQVTSTEEYPRLRPTSGRRGFVHKSIKVLPRQTCGLYTHTIFRDKYPGGYRKLERSIRGGELFESLLHNQVNIYMSHMSNYANDRLAISTFKALIEFVQQKTNLRLKFAADTNQLASHYFNLYPEEQRPLWTNPCHEKRHLAIWAPWKQRLYCPLAPQLLILGPQKSGTTALATFLELSPRFRTSTPDPELDFEEVQFFNDKHYHRGVDWYFGRFLASNGSEPAEELIRFDKSATYFDDPQAPARARSLLPKAYLVVLLVDPVERAYSWYQHQRAHGHPVAEALSFEQLMLEPAGLSSLRPPPASPVHQEPAADQVEALRSRCLRPGYYASHLSRWLAHYPARQLIIIDGLWFKRKPAPVLNRLQLILAIEQPLDYRPLLVYDKRKGFYCHRKSPEAPAQCLGPSKGRRYAPMSGQVRAFLRRHYWPENRRLARLLADLGQPLPVWLEEAMEPQ